jgi:hypothetical protein
METIFVISFWFIITNLCDHERLQVKNEYGSAEKWAEKKIGFSHKRRKEDGLLAALAPIGSSAQGRI